MKRLFCIFLCFLLLCSCSKKTVKKNYNESRLKGIWISCYELSFGDKSKQAFTKSIDKMLCEIKQNGFNTIFVHVRSHSDAYYNSKIFPVSSFIAGKQGKKIDYDPLEIITYFAKVYSLKIHAWINPFRIILGNNTKSISTKNPAYCLIKNNDRRVRFAEDGYYYNPAYKWVRNLILRGIEEVLKNYDIDGIHFDDYFYPTTEKSFDDKEYKASKTSHSLENWRRENIDKLIKSVYKLTHKYNKIFGVSVHCSFYYNYNLQYANVKKWCKNKGYTDYIAPQIYYGFSEKEKTPDNQPLAFKECLEYWKEKVKNVPIYIGLALYRCEEKGEFKNDNKIIAKQAIISCKKANGFIVFSYSYMKRNKKQMKNFTKKIKPTD